LVPGFNVRAAFGLCVPFALALAFAFTLERPAHAYCRTRTCEFRRKNPCPLDEVTGCSTEGAFVFWADHCISYAVQVDGSVKEHISAEVLEGLVGEGLQTWSDVACPGGGSPNLAAGSQGLTACDAVEYDCKEPADNSNIVMFRDAFQDDPEALRFGVIALTTLTANLKSGELFDADIEINSRDEVFALDGSGEVGAGEPRDLRGVVNHELGHLLGLSHSRSGGALMRAGYEGTTEPGADDVAGVCQALGAAATDPACSVAPLPADAGCVGSDVSCTSQGPIEESGGCSCRILARPEPNARARGAVLLLALGTGLWRTRRRHSVL